MNETQLQACLLGLEKQLMLPVEKNRLAEVAALIHDDFIEIGGSTPPINKAAVLQWLVRKDDSVRWQLSEFQLQSVQEGIVLVNYRLCKISAEERKYSVRSSLWLYENGSWQLRFHQATPQA